MDNFAVVSEIFIDESGNSSVNSAVYKDMTAGISAFYNKAQYIPLFKDKGYKAVIIIDQSGQNILPPVIRKN